MHEQEERPIDQTAAGYDLIEIPVEIMVQPLKPEVVWNETLAMLKSWNLPPMKTSSHFLEGVLPVIGPVVAYPLQLGFSLSIEASPEREHAPG